MKGIEVNNRIVINSGKIQMPSKGIEIDFSRAEPWESPRISDVLLSAGDRVGWLRTTARHILSHRGEPGLYLVLNQILEIGLVGLPIPPKPFEEVDFDRLLQLLRTTNLDGIVSALMPLLGSGAGLTPGGDDLIFGLLLAYHRWGTVLKPAFDLAELNALLNLAASKKTTLLSSNLIACASQGQADERLISALDGIMTGNPAPRQCARDLLSWGNSSGCDALVGKALAILSASG